MVGAPDGDLVVVVPYSEKEQTRSSRPSPYGNSRVGPRQDRLSPTIQEEDDTHPAVAGGR